MDLRLRLLQKQSQQDPQLVPAYIRALERTLGGSSVDPVIVWVVVRCHEETSSDDIVVFANELDAIIYMTNQMITDLRTARQQGALDDDIMRQAEQLYTQLALDIQTAMDLTNGPPEWARGGSGTLENFEVFYENLLHDVWFEISPKEVH